MLTGIQGGRLHPVKTWSDSFSVPIWRSHYTAQFYLHQEVGAFQKAKCLPGHITTQNFTSTHSLQGIFAFQNAHISLFLMGITAKINKLIQKLDQVFMLDKALCRKALSE
jgi:hypothetical protein